VPAERLPVARVCVDLPLAHLDRPFDYLVPAGLDATVPVGGRVRVRFAGQLVDGVVLERVAESGHHGRLAFLERSVSAEPVLTAEVARAAREVADRCAGTLADVLRLALPPRHARAEAEAPPPPAPPPPAPPPPAPPPVPAARPPVPTAQPEQQRAAAPAGEATAAAWSPYLDGPGFLAALASGASPRAVWSALPGDSWPARLAEAAAATLASGRGVVAVVPDVRDLERLDRAFAASLGAGHHVALSAALGPQERYRRWLAVRRGGVPAVVGTRAAAFAPVRDLGLVIVWDDGDDLHVEPRAPYCHAREVLLVRAQLSDAGALVGGLARTAEAQLLVQSGWARAVAAERDTVRQRAPRVVPAGDDVQQARDPAADTARLPTVAWQAARDALRSGAPVLVQVPRRGYAPALACERCRARARCPACSGPLALSGGGSAVAGCRWCGGLAGDWTCPVCGGRRLRAAVVGARRTAEELGRAFPGVAIRTSGRDAVLDAVPAEPALVVATPGAEPVVDGGYGAALLLDTWALLTRVDLRAAEEALRRWLGAAALVRPGPAGGRVVVVADGAVPVVQALVRWDPAGFAARELAERTELGFPPAVRMASLTGTAAAVEDLLRLAHLPPGAERLGPVPVAGPVLGAGGGAEEPMERWLLRVPRREGRALAAALHAAAGVRSARKAPDPVRVELDPHLLL